ncbi:MAG: hypothetical protein ACK4M7_00450 [Burkholderiales bacterium]
MREQQNCRLEQTNKAQQTNPQNFKGSVNTSSLTESYNANHPEVQIENPGRNGYQLME